MRFRCSAVLFSFMTLSLVVTAMPSSFAEDAPKADAEFQNIYTGKDLTGWSVYQGDLSCWQSNPDGISCIKEGGGWLRTNKVYSDFVLKVDYKIPEGGNSGIGIRVPEKGNVHQTGMEIQVLDDDAPAHKDLKAAQYTGSLYYQAPAKRGAASKPGEWNTMEVTCAGHHVKIVLNGQVINDVQLNEFTKAEDPEHYSPLADRPQVGFIALQSHGSRVDFRNIQVKNLTQQTASGLQYFDMKAGTGEVVPATATVEVHYTGWLTDGKKFDSSRDRGESISFPLNGVIKGWTEGLTGMKVGGRRKLVIPPDLAYGDRELGNGLIPANSTLVFDVEVLGLQ